MMVCLPSSSVRSPTASVYDASSMPLSERRYVMRSPGVTSGLPFAHGTMPVSTGRMGGALLPPHAATRINAVSLRTLEGYRGRRCYDRPVRRFVMVLLAACGGGGDDAVPPDAAPCVDMTHDEDRDGVGDACDICPASSDPRQLDTTERATML